MQCPTTGKKSSLKINSQLHVCFKHLKHLFHLLRGGPNTNDMDHSYVFNGLSPSLRPQKETKSYPTPEVHPNKFSRKGFIGQTSRIRTWLGSTFFKIVGTYPTYHVIIYLCNTNFMINHELSKLFTINQNNLFFYSSYILLRVLREPRSCDKNSLSCSMSLQAACELLNCRPANCCFPSLCLDINHVESKLVFFDNPVNTIVSRAPYGLPRILPRSSATNSNKQIYD